MSPPSSRSGPFDFWQLGGRWQAVASGGGSAYDLNPLVPAEGGEVVASGEWRENSGQGVERGQPRFPGARKWVAHSAPLGGGAQFPIEILGQLANGHRLKDGMPQDPLLTLSDDPWAGWG